MHYKITVTSAVKKQINFVFVVHNIFLNLIHSIKLVVGTKLLELKIRKYWPTLCDFLNSMQAISECINNLDKSPLNTFITGTLFFQLLRLLPSSGRM